MTDNELMMFLQSRHIAVIDKGGIGFIPGPPLDVS